MDWTEKTLSIISFHTSDDSFYAAIEGLATHE